MAWSCGLSASSLPAPLHSSGLAVWTPLRSLAGQDPVSASVARVVEEDVQQSTAQEQATTTEDNDPTATEARAEIARKWSVIAAFITAASLLVGAAAAFYGAHSGGHHRDQQRPLGPVLVPCPWRGCRQAPAGSDTCVQYCFSSWASPCRSFFWSDFAPITGDRDTAGPHGPAVPVGF